MIFYGEEEEDDENYIFTSDKLQIIKVHIYVSVISHGVFGNTLYCPLLLSKTLDGNRCSIKH